MNGAQRICYTRNFEDVILQRVFANMPEGCYVDVGASAPVNDSNTYALYTQGWRGICIDPMRVADWAAVRPGDVFIGAALGASPGETTFHIYESTLQISTASPETREHWALRGGIEPSRSVTVPVRTLDDVLDEHLAGRTLHLVSIDVEGMEEHVLRGFDLQRHRPWLILLEAVKPGTAEPNHGAWEPALLNNGYRMVYFDGVNRFYLAQEQLHLQRFFRLPPNVWDNFIPLRQLQLERRLQELEKERS